MNTTFCLYYGIDYDTSMKVCPSCGVGHPDPALPKETTLNRGEFTIVRALGRGGFRITYEGYDETLQRAVAIKELFLDYATRQSTLVKVPADKQSTFHAEQKRVLNEARRIAALKSPNIVEVHDTFRDNNTAYSVMEYLRGQTLEERIQDLDRLPEDEVFSIACGLCDALTVVHKHGILHRDIKPANNEIIILPNEYQGVLAKIIEKTLNLIESDRPQTIDEIKDLLSSETSVVDLPVSTSQDTDDLSASTPNDRRDSGVRKGCRGCWVSVAICIISLLAVAILISLSRLPMPLLQSVPTPMPTQTLMPTPTSIPITTFHTLVEMRDAQLNPASFEVRFEGKRIGIIGAISKIEEIENEEGREWLLRIKDSRRLRRDYELDCLFNEKDMKQLASLQPNGGIVRVSGILDKVEGNPWRAIHCKVVAFD